ncbi:hypothetical protein B0H17DRAFT_950011 [Mycena rosella]|uniref:Uncharacterized protein n=1 Tax=Mycena rosella TaxID=1033263 RepID=A0AAD7CX75_MYCRO|nr:hypothetical protein B0H17DRAFT_950011 [Mycena rosella]
MFIPLLSASSDLSRRKGGGSGHSSSKGGGKGGGSKGSPSTESGSIDKGTLSIPGNSGRRIPIQRTPISSGGSALSLTRYDIGGGKTKAIPSGQLFAGRKEGARMPLRTSGGAYGSGYPGIYTRGVDDRDFPFYFWPVAWGPGLGYGPSAGYMHTDEYGQPDNITRPGGAMSSATFESNSTGSTFHLVADNATATQLMGYIAANCSTFMAPSNNTLPMPFPVGAVGPEQVVQYFRASSVALSLDGYNNSAVFQPENSTADTALPSDLDVALLDCLNTTIGLGVPLIDGASGLSFPSPSMVALVLLLLHTLL